MDEHKGPRRWDEIRKYEALVQDLEGLKRAVMGWHDPITLERHPGLIEERDRKSRRLARVGNLITGILAAVLASVLTAVILDKFHQPPAEQQQQDAVRWAATRRLRFRDPETGRALYGWLEEKQTKQPKKAKPKPAAIEPVREEGEAEHDQPSKDN